MILFVNRKVRCRKKLITTDYDMNKLCVIIKEEFV